MTPEDAVRAIKDRATAVLSYRWLSDLHPDPNGFHMVAVRKALTSLVRTRAIRALFMDFLSCPQKDGQGQRTATEAAVFDHAKEAMSHFYASPRTLVLQHKRLPPGFTGYSYDQSGWCNFEHAVARLVQARTRLSDSPPSMMMTAVLLVMLVVLLVLLFGLTLMLGVLLVPFYGLGLMLQLMYLPIELLGCNLTENPRFSENGCLRADSFLIGISLKAVAKDLNAFLRECWLMLGIVARNCGSCCVRPEATETSYEATVTSSSPTKEVCQRRLELILSELSLKLPDLGLLVKTLFARSLHVPIHLSLAILISQIIEIGLDETPSPGSARAWSSLPDVTSLEEMDDLFRNEARTTFVGNKLAPISWAVRGDREKVATMFRDFAEKVVDLEYDSLPWVVGCAERCVHKHQTKTKLAIIQCFIISGVALGVTVLASNLDPPAKPPSAPPPPWPPPSLQPPIMTPTPLPPPPSPPFQTEPIVPFFFFAFAALLFALGFLCPILFKVCSPTYRARWYRCLARALCCKGLGNGPDPADWKRSIIYPSRSTQVCPSRSTQVPMVLPKVSNSISKRLLNDNGGGMELNTVASVIQADDGSTGRDELSANQTV